jgi:ketosteroid isomerase-like protein
MRHPDPDLDRRQVMAASDEEANAIVAGDAERLFKILADDAVMFPPNLPAKTGDDLRQWLREFLARVTIETLESAHGETVVAGDIAYHEYTCTWRVTPKAGGQPTVAHFKGLHIARRLPDGSWKLAKNIWNSSPTAASAR